MQPRPHKRARTHTGRQEAEDRPRRSQSPDAAAPLPESDDPEAERPRPHRREPNFWDTTERLEDRYNLRLDRRGPHTWPTWEMDHLSDADGEDVSGNLHADRVDASLKAYLRRHPDPIAAQDLHMWAGNKRHQDPFQGLAPFSRQSAAQQKYLDKLLKAPDYSLLGRCNDYCQFSQCEIDHLKAQILRFGTRYRRQPVAALRANLGAFFTVFFESDQPLTQPAALNYDFCMSFSDEAHARRLLDDRRNRALSYQGHLGRLRTLELQATREITAARQQSLTDTAHARAEDTPRRRAQAEESNTTLNELCTAYDNLRAQRDQLGAAQNYDAEKELQTIDVMFELAEQVQCARKVGKGYGYPTYRTHRAPFPVVKGKKGRAPDRFPVTSAQHDFLVTRNLADQLQRENLQEIEESLRRRAGLEAEVPGDGTSPARTPERTRPPPPTPPPDGPPWPPPPPPARFVPRPAHAPPHTPRVPSDTEEVSTDDDAPAPSSGHVATPPRKRARGRGCKEREPGQLGPATDDDEDGTEDEGDSSYHGSQYVGSSASQPTRHGQSSGGSGKSSSSAPTSGRTRHSRLSSAAPSLTAALIRGHESRDKDLLQPETPLQDVGNRFEKESRAGFLNKAALLEFVRRLIPELVQPQSIANLYHLLEAAVRCEAALYTFDRNRSLQEHKDFRAALIAAKMGFLSFTIKETATVRNIDTFTATLRTKILALLARLEDPSTMYTGTLPVSVVASLTKCITDEAESICMNLTSKPYQRLRWMMVGMLILLNALRSARNAGEPMNTIMSYVNENTGEPAASAPFPQSLMVMSHTQGVAEARAKVTDLEGLLHIHRSSVNGRRPDIELFLSHFLQYKEAYLSFLAVPLPDHMATQTLLRCINESAMLRAKKQADAPLQALAGDPQDSDLLAFLARVNNNFQEDFLLDQRRFAAMTPAARLAANVNVIGDLPSEDDREEDAIEPADKLYAIHVRDDRGGRLRACCPVCMAFGCRGPHDPHCEGVNTSGHRSLDARLTLQATGPGKNRSSQLCYRCRRAGHFARECPEPAPPGYKDVANTSVHTPLGRPTPHSDRDDRHDQGDRRRSPDRADARRYSDRTETRRPPDRADTRRPVYRTDSSRRPPDRRDDRRDDRRPFYEQRPYGRGDHGARQEGQDAHLRSNMKAFFNMMKDQTPVKEPRRDRPRTGTATPQLRLEDAPPSDRPPRPREGRWRWCTRTARWEPDVAPARHGTATESGRNEESKNASDRASRPRS